MDRDYPIEEYKLLDFELFFLEEDHLHLLFCQPSTHFYTELLLKVAHVSLGFNSEHVTEADQSQHSTSSATVMGSRVDM